MTNGQPGKALAPETTETVRELLEQGLSVAVVAKRAGISQSQVRNVRDANRPNAEELAEQLWPDEPERSQEPD